MKVAVHWPNRLLAEVTGDDGSNKLVFDGKTLTIYSAQDKKYATLSVPEGTTIDGMLKDAVGRHGLNFPLADFLSEAPDRAFLSGVTSGRVVNTVTIDGAPHDHLYFFQPPGIELELWLPKAEQALPRRLIVTYACYQDARFILVANPLGDHSCTRRRRAPVGRRAADRARPTRAHELRAGLCR
jgi:hypothetical protein